jgi:nicotinamide-nucleotide amidase
MNCIIISVGDELLIGQTINTNAGWMGSELNKIGVEVTEVLTISDQGQAINEALTYAETRAGIVLLTGGLGPTKDDITKKVFADFFNAPLVENKQALENAEGFFKRYNRPMLPVNKLQALVPEGCQMLLNKVGTAPGMWMENRNAVFVSMPGVPSEMRYLMQNEVLSRIKGQFKLPVIVHKTIMTLGLGESYIAEEIKDIEDALPSYIKLAYLPSPGLVKLRLSGKGEDKKILEIEIEALFDRIEERIPESVYARKEVMIEEIVGDKLRDKGYTIATAESCTSGALASKIASVSGASEYFIGSIVAYSNDVKKNILDVNEEVLMSAGAVSQETVKQMALGAKKLFGTDYAIATSGIAGPTGGTDEKPVGTVWIGIAFPQGVITEKFQMGKVRERVVRKTVLVALGRILSLIK